MKRRVIAFDLDGTLAVTKSAVSVEMAEKLTSLLDLYEVCVISGGKWEQFQMQLIDHLDTTPKLLTRLHIMPTSGTSYLRFDEESDRWAIVYQEDLSPAQRSRIIAVLEEGARHLGLWEERPFGEIIEDRGTQITFSALGQEAPPAKKYAWDPDNAKKELLRDYAARLLPDLEVHVGGTTSVDVTASGIDKAYGMRRLMDALGVSEGEILFFGDKLDLGGNDYPVKAMGIDTIAVADPDDTLLALQAIIAVT